MALVVADRVQETTTTTGTGTYTLAGAKSGFQSFGAVGDGNTTYYACTDGTDYEVGIGTYTASGTTLARTTIIESSNSDAAVNWGAGSKDIFVTLPASKATVLDASGDLTLTGASYNAVWDKSDNALEFANNAKAVFGTGSSLSIYGDGSNSYIVEGGTGDLRLQAANLAVQNTFGQYMIEANNGGAVNLYHNTSLKLGTESDGASIRGQLKIRNSSGTVQYTLPASDGSANQVLTTNGSGAVNFADAAGGGADLYAANESSPTAQPSATGANAIAIGDSAVASGEDAFAIGLDAVASGTQAMAFGRGTDATSSGALALGIYAQAVTGTNAVSIGTSYASGANSFAAAISTNLSSYGATGSNSIAMGYQSKATGIGNVNIGYDGYATGSSGSVAIGYRARATGTNAICLGQSGYSTASGDQSLAIGYAITSSGTSSAGIGRSHTISGDYSTALGRNSTIESNGDYSLAMGYEAKISQYGKNAHASGKFAAAGDAQGGQFILRADTTDATATVLTTNNSTAAATNQIVAASDTCITFDGTITAMQNGAQAYASWRIEGLLVNDNGTTTLANSATTVISNSSSWGMALSGDNTNNALAITCTGEASHNIRWVANIRTTEVTYA